MTQQEILEYNKRCAEILELEKWFDGGSYIGYHIDPERFNAQEEGDGTKPHAVLFESMKFHSDWNWIMEVVEAINKTQSPRQGGDTTHSTLKREVQALLGKTAKEAVVQAINQFLIWYNENNK